MFTFHTIFTSLFINNFVTQSNEVTLHKVTQPHVLKEAKNKTRMRNIEENLVSQQSNSWIFTDNFGRKLEYFMYIAIGFGPSIAALHALGNM